MPLRLPSPGHEDQTIQTSLLSPGWRHNRRSTSGGRSRFSGQEAFSARDDLINKAEKIAQTTMKIIRKMTPLQRVLAAIGLVVLGVLGLLLLIFNEKIFAAIQPLAVKWKQTTGGWTILWALTFLTAFPPIIGYSTCGTLAGFVYGIPEGWLILATATIVGSLCSFMVSRTVLRKYVEKLVANDKRFAALTLTLKQDGIKLLCMIRLCPLPYSLSNGAMSTFPTVEPQMYALATALITPKLFIHVFIGDRLARIAKHGGEMTAGTRAINYLSIAFFATIGLVTGWIIYNRTMAKAQEMEAEETVNARESFRRTGEPPRKFSDDSESQAAAEALARDDDDDVAYFDDTPSPNPPYNDSASDLDYLESGAASTGHKIGPNKR